MNANDFRKLVGVEETADDYVPVAFLLTTEYGCVGFYNSRLNKDLEDTCVLINARLVKMVGPEMHSRSEIGDFNSFIEEVASNWSSDSDGHSIPDDHDMLGTSIPLTAIPFEQIAIVYPLAHISVLMKRAESSESTVPTFLDFDNKSVVLKLLRTKLW